MNHSLEQGDILNRIVRGRTQTHPGSSFTSNPEAEEHPLAGVTLAQYFNTYVLNKILPMSWTSMESCQKEIGFVRLHLIENSLQDLIY